MEREALKETSRMVVKFGTGILTSSSKQIDPGQIEQLVAQVAAQCQAGREVVVVSSGAVGAGMGVLAMDKRPTDLSNLQACAAEQPFFAAWPSACRLFCLQGWPVAFSPSRV